MIRGQAAAAPDCWKSLTKRSISMVLPSSRSAYANVRIDDHDGFNVRRAAAPAAGASAGLAPVDAVIEASPAGLAQPQHSVVRRAVADEPHAFAIGPKGLHELFELILEVEHRRDDRKRRAGHDESRIERQNRGEIDRDVAVLASFGDAARAQPCAGGACTGAIAKSIASV